MCARDEERVKDMTSPLGAGSAGTLGFEDGARPDAGALRTEHRMKLERPPLTKIVATLGPATDDPEALTRLVANGASVFRLNFSHGDMHDHLRRVLLVRSVAQETGRELAILGDLGGPKIRVGPMPEEGVPVQPGQEVVIRTDIETGRGGERPVLPCGYARLTYEVKPGERVLIEDGSIRMLVVEATGGEQVVCRVTVGGVVKSRKGLNLPDSDISAPALTDFDRHCAAWAVEHDVDFLALSFVRTERDVQELKALLGQAASGEGQLRDPRGVCWIGAPIPVIAKIEKPQALERIDQILDEADGIMVARGDLGVELDLATVPIAQKRLIARAHHHGKPCIVATQMLETMIERPSPTRAEVSDVANAIYDGADAVMLSGETAVGRHGPLAVEMMRRVAMATERQVAEDRAGALPRPKQIEEGSMLAALTRGAWHMANDVGAQLIAVWSESGVSAASLSQNRFDAPILAYSSDKRAVRRMSMLYGVTPIHCTELPAHRSQFAEMVDRKAIEEGWVRRGDPMLLAGGKPFGVPGVMNTVALRTAGMLWRGRGAEESGEGLV